MNKTNTLVALFDFDGVIMDTEGQYTIFWDEQGRKYLAIEKFGKLIKGQTLDQIYEKYFEGMEDVQHQIRVDLDLYEQNMSYQYIPGLVTFLDDLRRHGVKMAIVTSSNQKKMQNVYRVHPDLQSHFDKIITADLFNHSKPDPECFLLGMQLFDALPKNTFVFEDSFHGLAAGIASGARVVALATTNSHDEVVDKAHMVIDDFEEMTFEKLLKVNCIAE